MAPVVPEASKITSSSEQMTSFAKPEEKVITGSATVLTVIVTTLEEAEAVSDGQSTELKLEVTYLR